MVGKMIRGGCEREPRNYHVGQQQSQQVDKNELVRAFSLFIGVENNQSHHPGSRRKQVTKLEVEGSNTVK